MISVDLPSPKCDLVVVMNRKKDPNHKKYIEMIRAMTPEQRLMKAFELTNLAREQFKDHVRARCPNITEEEMWCVFVERGRRKSQKKLEISQGLWRKR